MRKLLYILLLLLPLPAAAHGPHGVVFMYHRFAEPSYPTTNITREQFAAQLDYLQQNGFHIWPLHKLVTRIFSGGEVPDRTVAITIDDAYRSVYDNAFPLLRQRGIPATVFIGTEAVDQQRPGYMTWQQIREMAQHGIDFTNHGADHHHLTERLVDESAEAWRQRVVSEIKRAQGRLDDELGAAGPRLFAYPYGEFDQALQQVVIEMGYTAFGQHSGAIGPLSDRSALPRFPINERYAKLDSFAVKAASLPLPVTQQHPADTQVSDENPPTLVLRLAEDAPRSIRCYLGNGSPINVAVREERSVAITAHSPLRSGRSRYNCTALAGDGRFYWFSHPWLNGPDATDPAR